MGRARTITNSETALYRLGFGRRAQAAAAAEHRALVAHKRTARRATYGRYRVDDPRTWFSGQWAWALNMLAVVAALPAMFGDGPIAEAIWLVPIALGILSWGVRLAHLHEAQAPPGKRLPHG